MRLGFFGGILAVLIVAALIVAYSSLFTVYQTQQALVVRLGQPVRAVNEPEATWRFRANGALSLKRVGLGRSRSEGG